MEHYRRRCLQCHDPGACRLAVSVRRERNGQDDCAACHMPKSQTDIVHFAFTHHRVGIHASQPEQSESAAGMIGRLVPAGDLSHLPHQQQQRLLGLAYLEWSDKQTTPAAKRAYQDESLRLLEASVEIQTPDPEVTAALARIYWERGADDLALQFALQALGGAEHPVNALFVAGDCHLRKNNVASAMKQFEQLVQHRRLSQDWLLLGACRNHQGDLPGALAALEKAAAIDPSRLDILRLWIAVSERAGKSELARTLKQKLAQFQQSRAPAVP
jgi:Flp pilus assembly protein TadD